MSDILNDKFNSKDYRNVAKFYDEFRDRSDLIQWMKDREIGKADVYEISGDSTVVVVILTRDHTSEFPRSCAKQIFTGLHIIYVENGYNDSFFNFSRSSNVGLTEAMRLQPEWIIQASDDMFKIDGVSKLISELKALDNRKYDAVFTLPPSKYHSHRESIGKRNLVRSLFYSTYNLSHRMRKQIEDKYDINYMIRPGKGMSKLMLSNIETITLTQAFGIFSPNYLRKFSKGPYDPVYINNIEEFDLSYELNKEKKRLGYINYRVGDYVGMSFGNGLDRWMRSLASEVYFNYKLEKRLSPFEKFRTHA